MTNKILRTALLAAITFTPALAIADSARPTPAETAKAPKTAAADEASTYSQREADNKQAAEFQGGMIESTGGGTVVVISGAALALVLILAVLVL